MGALTELKQLEAEVKRLQETIEAERKAAGRAGRVPLAVASVLVLLLVCFLLINYFKVRSELTPENLEKSIQSELREVSPTAFREFNILGKDLLPVYLAEVQKQLQAAWPEICDKLEREIVRLGDSVTEDVNRRLSESEAQVLRKTELALFENFPQLKDEKKSREIERRLHELCDGALTKAMLDFDGLFSKDVTRMQEALLKFDVTDTTETAVDLEKKFLHLWLELLDQEIMEL